MPITANKWAKYHNSKQQQHFRWRHTTVKTQTTEEAGQRNTTNSMVEHRHSIDAQQTHTPAAAGAVGETTQRACKNREYLNTDTVVVVGLLNRITNIRVVAAGTEVWTALLLLLLPCALFIVLFYRGSCCFLWSAGGQRAVCLFSVVRAWCVPAESLQFLPLLLLLLRCLLLLLLVMLCVADSLGLLLLLGVLQNNRNKKNPNIITT